MHMQASEFIRFCFTLGMDSQEVESSQEATESCKELGEEEMTTNLCSAELQALSSMTTRLIENYLPRKLKQGLALGQESWMREARQLHLSSVEDAKNPKFCHFSFSFRVNILYIF